MSQFDRDKWNNRYSQPGSQTLQPPTELWETAGNYLPLGGRALDVAGGTGRNSWPLAERGWDVTLADISQIALDIAEKEAARRGVALKTQLIDLELEPFPAGPWDAIIQVCFLNRDLYPKFPQALAPGGLLILAQPTARNLERHDKPPRPFVLEEGEILSLVAGLEILHYSEAWQPCGRHEAQLIARR